MANQIRDEIQYHQVPCYEHYNSKSSYIYTLNNHILKHVDHNPYLGLTLSNTLIWGPHINRSYGDTRQTVKNSVLRRNLSPCPKECKRTAYTAIVRSIMEYGCLERIQ